MADAPLSITSFFTADDKLQRTLSFGWSDPFSLVLDFLVQPALLNREQTFEAMIQIVNWRTDPTADGTWLDDKGKPRYTLDFMFSSVFQPSEIPVKTAQAFQFKQTWPASLERARWPPERPARRRLRSTRNDSGHLRAALRRRAAGPGIPVDGPSRSPARGRVGWGRRRRQGHRKHDHSPFVTPHARV